MDAHARIPSSASGPAGFPRQFDSYVLIRPLARGGMGQLYLALAGTTGLEKLCVVKQVPPDVLAPENARRFRDEAMVALRLSHGNLVTVFDAGLQSDRIFLAMDFVDGTRPARGLEPLRRTARPLPRRHRGLRRSRSSAAASPTRTRSRI